MRSDNNILNSGMGQPATGREDLPSSRLARLRRVAFSLHELMARAEGGGVPNMIIWRKGRQRVKNAG
jgi:hypothetical protein